MNNAYELVDTNAQFIIVYKKPGVSFHSDDGKQGLFEVIKQCEGLQQLYPVHRLDKVTSGLLVMAKTAAANQELVDQFKYRQVEKYYLAVSARRPKKKQGQLKGDMEPARRGAWKLAATCENPAITQFFSAAAGEGKRLFIVKPHTGKTHQIRVALKSIGAPILGDSLYADASSCNLIDRVYLHAYSLAFTLNGQGYRYTEPPREGEIFFSAEMAPALHNFSSPWLLPWPRI